VVLQQVQEQAQVLERVQGQAQEPLEQAVGLVQGREQALVEAEALVEVLAAEQVQELVQVQLPRE
jgi:hypothetical protein